MLSSSVCVCVCRGGRLASAVNCRYGLYDDNGTATYQRRVMRAFLWDVAAAAVVCVY